MENESVAPSKESSPKTGLVLLLVLFLLLIGGAGYLLLSKNTTSPLTTKTVSEKKNSPTASSNIASIQEALAKSLSLECHYTDGKGTKTTSYIKSGAVRTDIVMPDNPKGEASVIMKNNKMYSWSGKQGVMMEFDMSEMIGKITPSAQSAPSSAQKPQEILDSLEKLKDSCKSAVIADSLFTPPSDVTFTDMSQIIKTGVSSTPGVGSETSGQIKKLQEQYQPKQ